MPIVERELTRKRHPTERRNPTLYPSSASVKLANGRQIGGCWRADWYRIHDVPDSDPSNLYIKLSHILGNAVEKAIIEGMKRAGIYEHEDVRVYVKDFNLSGKLDIVGRYRADDSSTRYYGTEAKSCWGQGALKHIKGRARPWKGQPAFQPKPKDSALMQTMIYLWECSEGKGTDFVLDWFQLIYIPRDQTGMYREYTVTLVEIDGKHYAKLETEDFLPYIEKRFSVEDIYASTEEEMRYINEGIIPERTYKRFYSEEEIEALRDEEEIGKTAYEDWVKAGKPLASLKDTPGHFLCQSYCEYRSFCYLRNGKPNPEADLVGIREGALNG